MNPLINYGVERTCTKGIREINYRETSFSPVAYGKADSARAQARMEEDRPASTTHTHTPSHTQEEEEEGQITLSRFNSLSFHKLSCVTSECGRSSKVIVAWLIV